jgi:outer membrane protein
MMNRTILALVAVMGMVAFGAQAQDQRIVFIDLDRVFNEFYKTKLADAQLKDQAEEFNEERRKLVEEFETLQAKFTDAREEAQNTALSEEVRNRKRNEAEELLIDIREFESRMQRFDTSRRKQLEDQGRRMRTRIVTEIQDVISNHARNQGYTSVIDSSGQSLNAVEIVLYVDPRVDISEAVIELLNKGQGR